MLMVKLALNMTWTIKNDREAAKFKIDGSRLTRDSFADAVIYNKVLYYPDFNSKLKVIKGKVSTKNIIPDMGHGRPIDFSHIRTYLCQLLSCTRYRVSRQYRRHSQIRPKISLVNCNKLKQIKMRL